ncbi:MAG: hypothetical protein QNJ48_02610 [Desulfobacterales bacterium]|nr:hypothetical protein [Desulfobacterales bacterium]
MRKVFLGIAFMLLLTGCIKRPWSPTPTAEHFAPSQNVRLTLPEGWMLNSREDVLLVTRDGILLQNVIVAAVHVDDELKYTKKKFKPGMLPIEQAGVIHDNMASNPNRAAFKVLSKKPAQVAGHQAFRSEVTYKDDDGLRYRGILYGFMQNDWFYLVRYMAPERHYFARDKDQFENIVRSMRLVV